KPNTRGFAPILFKGFFLFLSSITFPINECEHPTHTSKVRYISFQRNLQLKIHLSSYPEMLNPNFFRAKTFNIFYVFGCEKFSTSSIRAPIKPRKFPQKHLENPQKHLEFPTSDVFLPLYGAKKRGKNPVFRALSSSLVQR
ncbi:MAG: hypothetical protein MSS61_09520, partial [Bacteroidales bacterium]|nr:hypothetical protein [Bacteroidales bacterium]